MRMRHSCLILILALASAGGVARAQDAPADSAPQPPAGVALPPVAPIITEREFDAAIPPLDGASDPELDRPLESIADFERRMASDTAAPAPGGDGEAPVRDAELLAPLAPLSEFDVEPVTFADAAPDDEAEPQVAYSVKVEGLEQVDGDSRAHLADTFHTLSSLRAGKGKAASQAMVAARLREDADLLRRILASEGWYDPQLTTRIDQPGTSGPKALRAVIDVSPGKRFTLSSIKVVAQPTVPLDLIASNLALRVGEPIIADRVQGAEAQIAVALPQNGYAFAQVGQRDLLLDEATGEGEYTLPVETGPRVRFGGIETTGDLAFGAPHIDILSRFRPGDLYDSRKVDDLRQALIATGLLSTVSVEPQRTGVAAGGGDQLISLLVRQDAGPPRTIAGTLGYNTGEGIKIEGSWTHRNLIPPEGALILRGLAGTREQSAGAIFRRSNAGRRDRTFELTAEALHSKFDAFSAYTGRLAARVAYDSTPIWQKRYTWAYGVTALATSERDYDPARQARDQRMYYVAGLSGQAGLDFTDSLLDPTRGVRLTALVEPEGSLSGGFHPYVRARIDGSVYTRASDSLVLAARARIGTIQGVALQDIAPSRRLYAGGGGSVRGYGYQMLGPLDPNGDPIGGRSLAEASGELRYRFGDYGVVGFFDVGQSWAARTPRFTDLRMGAGIGGRFYTNFGPMRVDVATPIDRRKGEGRINVYVSIGQAF